MTREQLNKRIERELKPSEIALINFNIYWNREHIDYYENYHLGDYQWCYDYLIKNRHLLNIKHTPMGQKSMAKKIIQMAKSHLR
jgi:hypothetical protein